MYLVSIFATVLFAAVPLVKGTCDLGTYEQGVNSNEQNVIVTKHNDLRLLLAQGNVQNQPKAINMKRLKYDGQLAAKAQEIANTCVFQHVSVSDSRWKWIGQNLFMTMSTNCQKGSDWNSAIQSWFDEYKKYHYPDNPSSETGHYTQVAWATTEYVGCGYTFFPSTGTFKCKKIYVCNYGPGGNIIGQAPYKTGSSGCPNLC